MVQRKTEIVEKITFSDLSWDLKLLVVIMWIISAFMFLAFMVGVFTGLLAQ